MKKTPIIDVADLRQQLDEKTPSLLTRLSDQVRQVFANYIDPAERNFLDRIRLFRKHAQRWVEAGKVGDVVVRRYVGWDKTQGKYTGAVLREIRRSQTLKAIAGRELPFNQNRLVDLWKATDFVKPDVESRQVRRAKARAAVKLKKVAA